jgi:TusA-related sulfurtransferase
MEGGLTDYGNYAKLKCTGKVCNLPTNRTIKYKQNMKRLLLGAILLLSTTNAFSQNNTIEGKWKMQNFDNTLFIFENGERFTYYCTAGNCDSLYNTFEAGDGNHIPGTEDYSVSNDTITMDYHFGNILVTSMVFSCEGNIVTFVDQSNLVYIRLGTNINDCNSVSITEETQNPSLTNSKYYDLLGREIEDITTYPIHSLYIKNGRKYMKAQ